jgi:hypothetical protein
MRRKKKEECWRRERGVRKKPMFDCDGEKQESRAWTYSKVALVIDRREQGKGEL